MSKQALQQEAYRNGGVTVEDSVEALQLSPSLYERIGREEGFELLSRMFYDRVFADKKEPWFLNIFSSSTKQEAIESQFRFLVQTFGGPDLYKQKKGKYTRLAGRHANYNIGLKAAARWMDHMTVAVEEHPTLQHDEEARKVLLNYFQYTAYYIVAASAYMRPDQLSGGTRIDSGRVW